MRLSTDKFRHHLLPALGLVLLALAVFAQTVSYDFLSNWDDYQYVTSNPDIRGFSAANLIRIFSSSYLGNYAPVHLLSYMLDYQLAGLHPGWFHGVNVGIHIACGLLFYLLVHRLTGKPLWAFSSAAIFLLHPVQVESVAWVTERKNLLAMFFSLLSFLSYLSYRRGEGEKKHLAYFLSLLFLVLALFSKSVAVVMPVVFLLHDLFLEEPRRGGGLLTDKIAFVVAAAATSGIAIITQSVEMGGGRVDFFDGDLYAKTLTMLSVFAKYLQLLLLPTNGSLNSIYILFIKSRFDAEVAVSLILVAALAGLGVYLMLHQRRLFFGFALFFVALLPVSQIVPLATLMNDRYLYFPMLGAAWIAGSLLSSLHDRFAPRRLSAAHLVTAFLIVPLLLVSFQRCGVWKNSIALWSDVVRKYPTLKDQRAALAAAYIYDGQNDKALSTYQDVFALKRDFSDPLAEQKAYLEAARLYFEKGEADKAVPLLTTLNTKYPDQPRGYVMLGDYHSRTGNRVEAEKEYRTAALLQRRR